MATSPAFSNVPNPGTPGVITAANAAMDGTGATGRILLLTAAANGSMLERVIARRKGTGVKTVARVWLNNGSDPEVATNNTLLGEFGIPAGVADADDPNPSGEVDKVLNFPVGKTGANANRIYVTLGTAVADGIHFTPVAGDF